MPEFSYLRQLFANKGTKPLNDIGEEDDYDKIEEGVNGHNKGKNKLTEGLPFGDKKSKKNTQK